MAECPLCRGTGALQSWNSTGTVVTTSPCPCRLGTPAPTAAQPVATFLHQSATKRICGRCGWHFDAHGDWQPGGYPCPVDLPPGGPDAPSKPQRAAAQPAAVDWSFLRSVLSQGADIHQDYLAGRHATYEHYQARLDVAAHERLRTVVAPAPSQDDRIPRDPTQAMLDAADRRCDEPPFASCADIWRAMYDAALRGGSHE